VTTLEIRRAMPHDVPAVAAILGDAIAWAAEAGFDSWDPGSFADPHGWGRQRLFEALEANALYLIWLDGQTVGTFSILPVDPLFWPDAPDDALYLHRFAVRDAHRGAGIGAAALDWIVDEARRTGRRYLRLDCLEGNPGIRAYYERAGFDYRGGTTVNGLRFSLYELDVSGPQPA
jgi:protein-tyrosine phosphatase